MENLLLAYLIVLAFSSMNLLTGSLQIADGFLFHHISLTIEDEFHFFHLPFMHLLIINPYSFQATMNNSTLFLSMFVRVRTTG